MDQDLLAKITRLRRGTTNKDVMDVCDALERVLLIKPNLKAEAFAAAWTEARARFDKKTYQREYMRNYRIRKKAAG